MVAQHRPVGNGEWIYNMNGTDRVLYRLHDLMGAPNDCVIYVCEGEKDTDRLHAEGMVATTNPGGAGKWKCLADDSSLHNRNIVILPHKEELGRMHAIDVATRLYGKAKFIRIVPLPALPAKGGNVSDWFNDGNDVEYLNALITQTPVWKPSPYAVAADVVCQHKL